MKQVKFLILLLVAVATFCLTSCDSKSGKRPTGPGVFGKDTSYTESNGDKVNIYTKGQCKTVTSYDTLKSGSVTLFLEKKHITKKWLVQRKGQNDTDYTDNWEVIWAFYKDSLESFTILPGLIHELNCDVVIEDKCDHRLYYNVAAGGITTEVGGNMGHRESDKPSDRDRISAEHEAFSQKTSPAVHEVVLTIMLLGDEQHLSYTKWRLN